MGFENKIVVITGAGRGIGRDIAMTYAARGATAVIAEKDRSTAAETVQIIENAGGKAVSIPVDVSIPEEIVKLFTDVEAMFGIIDILVNNAAAMLFKSPYELTVEEWDREINTNLRGVFLCSREAARVMRKKRSGSIVNISSTRGLMSEPCSEAYAASKGGIIALTHAMAASFSSDNIQVNCISPGWIETGDYGALRESDHKQHFANRVGMPADISRACLYLTDEENGFVSAVNLVVDGGMTKKMIYSE